MTHYGRINVTHRAKHTASSHLLAARRSPSAVPVRLESAGGQVTFNDYVFPFPGLSK
jgi:hypothetical protein